MTKRLLCFFLLASATFAAETGMRLTIPRATHPPTLDGKLAADEWDDATAVTGIINQFDGVAHPRQATFWLKYDDKNMYVAQRSSLLPGEKASPSVMPPFYFKDNQNAVVIALAPNRVNSGDTPSWYRFMANITSTNLNRRELCDQIKGVKFISISSSWDSLDARHQTNSSKSFNSFNTDNTVWESEYAIPLPEMKVEKTPDGEEWGVLLARDYPQLDQNAIVQTASYRFDYNVRDWRNLGVAAAYHLPDDYARASLSATAPVVQVLELGDVLNGKLAPKFAFYNPTTIKTSLTVEINGQRHTILLAAGEHKPWSAEVKAASQLTLAVTDATGRVLFRQQIPIRVGYGCDRVALVPDVWFAGEPKMAASAIIPLCVYNPIHNTLWTKVALLRPELKKDQVRVDVSVRRPGEDKPFVTYPMSPKVQGWGDFELQTKLPTLKPGVYQSTATVFDKQTGKLLARSSDLFIRYDHKKDLPWIDTKIGVTDKVLPPWTPIETKKRSDGLVLSCWGRDYTVDGGGLPTQIKTLDENILSGPVHLEMTRDGKSVPLKPSPHVRNLKARPHEADYEGSLRGDGWKITTSAHLEYDGYLLYRIRFEPQGTQSMDSIKFVVPLTDVEGRYMHAASCNDGIMRGFHTTQALKVDKGVLWDSSEQAAGPTANGQGLKVGNFKSYVWVGGVKRGLAFMADNDKDWVPDDTKKVSSSEVVRTDTGVNLVLNLVARPFTFTHAREITFSLQATPLRPLPDDFRQARNQLALGTAFVGGSPDGWAWNGCMLWFGSEAYLGGQSSAPFPLNWERNKEWINGGVPKIMGAWNSNVVVTTYQAMDAFFAQYEINDPRAPGLQGANWYGYMTPEITGHRDIYDAAMSQTEVQYRIWRYQRWIKENGLQGFYFDNSFSGFSANPAAGLGYVIDLPDRPALNGQIQPGFAWTGMRDMLKRLRTVIVESGRRPYLWIHATDTYVMGAYAFADVLLDGENGPMITPTYPWFSEKWSPDYMQTLNDGAKWGLATTMLEMMSEFTGPNNVGQWRLAFRDLAGWLMLHDNEGSSYRYLDWSGLDLGRKSEFLPYWDPAIASALQTGNTNVLASAWRQDNAVRVEVFNRNGEAQKNLTLRIDPKALGMVPGTGKPFVVKDLEAGVPKAGETKDDPYIKWPGDVGEIKYRDDNGLVEVTLSILPHDYRLLKITQTQH